MKRGFRLLLLGCVLVVAVGGYLLLSHINTENEDTASSEDTEETVDIAKPASTDIRSMEYVYDGETVCLTRTDSSSDWEYADDSSFPLDQTYPAQMAAAVAALSPTRSFAGGDVADYGLDDPDVSVTVTDADGNQYVYSVGDENDLTYEYYLSADDSGTVYLVDSSLSDAFSNGLFDIVEEEDIPQLKDVQSIAIDAEAKDVSIYYDEDAHLSYSDSVVWYLNQNETVLPLGTDEVESLIDSLNDMTWSACVSYNADQESLGIYGLLEPAATVRVAYYADVTTATGDTDSSGNPVTTTTSEERTYTLELGSYVGDYCYARLGDSDMVYTIDASLADSLLTAGYASLRSDSVCDMSMSTVDSLDVTIDGVSHTIGITIETTANEDGDATETYAYTLDGAALDSETAEAFLSTLTGLTWTGDTADGDAAGLPEVSVTFHRNTETYATMTLALARYGSDAYRVSFTDADGLLVSADDVTSLMDAFTALSEASES